MNKGHKIVSIGDTHAHPAYDNNRFGEAGQFCAEEQPDIVHLAGDFADVVSLNSHGTKLELEGSRWKDDVAVTHDALSRFFRPIRARKKKMPYIFMTLGNHEHRINRWIAENPKFEGTMSVEDLGFRRFGIEVFPFGQFVDVCGFRFVHHVTTKTGGAGKVGSPTFGYKSQGVSCVVGHTHTMEHHTHYYQDRRIHGIDLGCLIHKDMGGEESWSNPTSHTYWRGVHVFENAANGDADFRTVRAETLGV